MVGKIVRINCKNNPTLNGKIGQVVLDEDKSGFVFGTCVLIDGSVYGFDRDEVEPIESSKKK